MSKRKPMPPRRSLRPTAECLETRQLLSLALNRPTSIVRGTDPQGDQWSLKLYGPGTLHVVDTNGDPFTKVANDTVGLIDTITVAGAITSLTRVVGTVYPAPGSAGQVYFQNLIVTPTGELGKIDAGQVSNFRIVQNGIKAIDMPDFYLAHTETATPSTDSLIHTNIKSAGNIYIPQGVITLRFGGVNVDFTPAGGTPLNQTAQSNEFQINLGLPLIGGTSIIVNTVNSDAEANSTAGSAPFQDFATFLVTGRLNLFQANEIDGNTTSGLVPTQLLNSALPTSGASVGGTMLVSQGGPASGQIGNVRIGGNVTNFTTFVDEDPVNSVAAEGQLDAKISNFYIGGETNNVLLVAPSGSRNISFGLGMDNVNINSLAISSLRANRDATNSNVTVERSLGNLLIGGAVTDTNVNVGQSQSLFLFANTPPTVPTVEPGTGVFWGDPPPSLVNPQHNGSTGLTEPFAQSGGTIMARIAGNVTNSVFSASVDPSPAGSNTTVFGPGNDLVLSRGVINAKVEGTIDNSTNNLVSSSVPANTAFFASIVHVKHGPIIPPVVPYQPTVTPTVYHKGQNSLKGLFKIDHYPKIIGKSTTKKK
jgi:hypothetical protein